jgi:hypothetical protein
VPHLLWNLRIVRLLRQDRIQVRRAIQEWHQTILRISPFVRTLTRKKDRLRLLFDSEESATVASNMLREHVGVFQHLQVFRYLREVDVRSLPFTKGLATEELAGHLGVQRAHILAIGNGHNDASMLGGQVAAMTGCPANSDAEVMEVVHRSRGHIAKGRALAGVVEILDAYREGTVSSDLPEDWTPPSDRYNPRPSKSRRHRRQGHPVGIALAMLGVYAVLLVFANFRLLGPLSGIVMLPYRLALALFQKAMTHLLG